MSKRNTESLRNFFNRCNEAVENFDPMAVEIECNPEGGPCPEGQILCRRGDLFLMGICDDENMIEYYYLSLNVGGYPLPSVDGEIARWLVKRARERLGKVEIEDKTYRDTDAACQSVLSGDLPQEHKNMASRHILEARERLGKVEAEYDREAGVLAKYIIGCAWGAVGNAFIGRRRSSWDGHHASRLVVQGRMVCVVVTDKHNQTTRVRVLSEAESEAAFQDERSARQQREAAYAKELEVAREMVQKWKAGDNTVEFTFHNGQEGGYIAFEYEGKILVVSAKGAGIEHGSDPEFDHSASSDRLREWDAEQEFESAIERSSLWRNPAKGESKARVGGEWFGMSVGRYTLNDSIDGVGRVQAIARA